MIETTLRSRSTPFRGWILIILMVAAGLPSALSRKNCCSLVVCNEDVWNTGAPQNGASRILTPLLLSSEAPELGAWQPVALQKQNFVRKGAAVEFPSGNWINVNRPLSMSELKGKLVLLDFWTYCCINCMHILPVLEQIEEKHKEHLLVVGVHTAKFTTEADTKNIREAVLRYGIKHPVINDEQQYLWKAYQVNTWPTLVLVDPEGGIIWNHSGEITVKELDSVLTQATARYKKSLSGKPIALEPLSKTAKETPLKFPGKILADSAEDRIFISDSSHHRIVISKSDGTLLSVIGSGLPGDSDGKASDAKFRAPQGLARYKDKLFVADTENHRIRQIDLTTMQVTTVAGTGVQTKTGFPGYEGKGPFPKRISRNPRTTPLGSPWDLWIHGEQLYIAMAGPHQIWKMDVEGKAIGPIAGSGLEDIIDGPQYPMKPYTPTSSAFAQPSGLVGDDQRLFVADSEGSSIRIVPFDEKGLVETLIGTSLLPDRRLFTFGDRDGGPGIARFQHPLGLALHKGRLFVADTYNNKIKTIDLETREVRTVIGSAEPGETDDPPLLNEPSGLSIANGKLYVADTNNHKIRVLDLRTTKVTTLAIKGLQPPGRTSSPQANRPTSAIPEDAIREKQDRILLQPQVSQLELDVSLELPTGWKLNEEAPLGYIVQTRFSNNSPLTREPIKKAITPPKTTFRIVAPVAKDVRQLEVAVTYYYCRADGKGVCLAETVVFDFPMEFMSDAPPPRKINLTRKTPKPLGL